MKKQSHSPKAQKTKPLAHLPKVVAPLDNDPLPEETEIASDQFAVAGREDEASSSGHRVEPIINDEEGNAETLIEEGLHGYLRASPNHTHRGK